MIFLNISSRSSYERKIIKPLLSQGKLFLTNSKNIRDPNQKYYSIAIAEQAEQAEHVEYV